MNKPIKINLYCKYIISCFLLWLIHPLQPRCQQQAYDSSYYVSFDDYITGRVYLSRKYTNLELQRQSPDSSSRFSYRPNTTLNLGIGATYKSLTINLAYGFDFLNPEQGKGKTRYLDLQSHLYGRSWVIDLYGQFYKGYYLWPQGLNAKDGDSYYTRPDIRVNLVGVNIYHLFNARHFSYRAALIQNEWQKKSAGSFLAGGEAYYGVIHADSAFVPASLSRLFRQKDIRLLRFAEIGAGVGYAHTFVIKQHFFFTGSLTGSLNMVYVREKSAGHTSDKVTITPNYNYKLVAGYNIDTWTISMSIVGNEVHIRGASSPDKYFIMNGNFRLTFAKRFLPGPRLKHRLRPLDNFLESK